MLESAAVNIKNHDEFGLFEIGTIIANNEAKRHLSIMLVKAQNDLKLGYYQIKDIVYNLFKSLKNIDVKFDFFEKESYYNNELSMGIIANNDIIGYITVFNRQVSNQISKKSSFICADIDFDKFTLLETKLNLYEDVSKYPTTTLDYTIITKRGIFYKKLDEILNKFTSPIILDRKLVDIYLDGENKKITIRYTVGSKEKTLTSEELEDFKNQFINYLAENDLSIIE